MIIRFLDNEGAYAHDITQRLQAWFAEDAYTFRMVQFWIGEVYRGNQDVHDQICIGSPLLDHLNAKILAILDKFSFRSARSIAGTLRVGLITVLQRLHDFIGFRSFHLHWVPHIFAVGFCEKQIEYAQAMLPFWHAAERNGWHHLVTGDELWSFLDTSSRRIWTLSRYNVITKPRHDIQSEKCMFTIRENRTASIFSTDSQMIPK
jgi:hypothetical protein